MKKKSELYSIIITFSLWLIFGLCGVFIPLPEKQEYEKFVTVKLQLPPADVPKEKIPEPENPRIEETLPPVTSSIQDVPVEKTEEAITVQKEEIPVAKKTEASKTETPSQSSSTPKKNETVQKFTPVKQELQKSMEELMAEQNANTSKKASIDNFDWSSLETSSGNSSDNTSQSEKEQHHLSSSKNALAGTAAQGSTISESSTSSTTSTNFLPEQTTNTSDFLANIASKKYTSEANDFKTATTLEVDSSSDGSIKIKMADGKTRKLIMPQEPKIILPENAKVETSVETEISFTVSTEGTVISSSIKIENESLLSSEIVSAIKQQLSQWWFEKANSNGQARFNYSIIKK